MVLRRSAEEASRVKIMWDNPQRVKDPSFIPPKDSYGYSIDWSPDGQYLAFGYQNFSPYFVLYKKGGDNFIKFKDPEHLPVGCCQAISWSPDGEILALGTVNHQAGLLFYEFKSGKMTKLPGPDIHPDSRSIQSLSWAPNWNHLAVTSSSPGGVERPGGFSYYKRDGTNFIKGRDPLNLPSIHSTSFSTDWSPDDLLIAMSSSKFPYIYVWTFNGYLITSKLPDVHFSELPSGPVDSVNWSSDKKYLAVAGRTIGTIIYERNNQHFTKLNILENCPIRCTSVEWSPDAQMLAVTSLDYPFITLYKMQDNKLARMPNLPLLPDDAIWFVKWSPDGQYLAAAGDSSPYLFIYKSD